MLNPGDCMGSFETIFYEIDIYRSENDPYKTLLEILKITLSSVNLRIK